MKHFTTRRTAAGLLALLAVGSTLLSCSDSGEGSEQMTTVTTSAAEAVETETAALYRENVPAADFGGETFRVIGCDPEAFSCILGFDFDEDSADSVESAIYHRNRAIEERYNVTFEHEYRSDWAEMADIMRNAAISGDDYYQLIMMINREAFKAAISGYVMPYENIPHIDTTQPWYMQKVNEMLTIGDTTVVAYTDECTNAYLQTVCVFYNKQILAENDLANPYELVREGKWTQDAFYEMATTAIRDINGDSKYDINDTYGIITEGDMLYPAMWVGAGINTVEKDENDIPVYTAPGNERLISAIDKLVDHIVTDGFMLDSFDAKLGDGEQARINGTTYFAEGKSLFRVGVVAYVRELRDMNADFGILPTPKYDETQEGYYGRMIDGWIHLPPSSVQNLELLGTMMEALGAESKNYVIPAFFDVALTQKLTRDVDSEEMLDIIFDNITLDLGDTVWYEDIRGQLQGPIADGKRDMASRLTKIEKRVNKTIEKALEAFNNREIGS